MSEEIERYEGEREAPAPITLFGTDDPEEVIRRASAHAKALADVIEQRHLSKDIQGRKHVLVDGWTLLGSMLGVFPVVVWTHALEDGWEARVEARTRSGEVVGAAEAECRATERNWGTRDSYAVRSMAQTRAISKALRAPLGFIVTLAGYDATPEAEIPAVVDVRSGEPTNPPLDVPENKATQKQHGKLALVLKQADESDEAPPFGDDWTDYAKAYALATYGVRTRADLNTRQMSELIDHILTAAAPFS